jgi:CPA2 family monovalent cation:H+ antiporter-2
VSLPLGRWVAGSLDLTALTGLAYCFGAAAVSGLVGLSAAFGAFLAGLVIGNSAERIVMLNATKPIQSVLLMIFFLSVGLLIDLGFIWRELGTVLVLLLFVTVLKTALNVAILHALGARWYRAFLAGTVLGQIGEFSFVLVAAGGAVGTLGEESERLMVAVIALSLVVSPLWLLTARRLHGLATMGVSTLGPLLAAVYGNERALADRAATRVRAYWARRPTRAASYWRGAARAPTTLGETVRRAWRDVLQRIIAARGQRPPLVSTRGATSAESGGGSAALDGEIIPPPPKPPPRPAEPLDWSQARRKGEVPPPRGRRPRPGGARDRDGADDER